MKLLLMLSLVLYSSVSMAADLLSIETKSLVDSKTQIILEFDKTPSAPVSFALSDPAKLIFDFIGVGNKLPDKEKQLNISSAIIRKLTFAASNDKLRLIVDASNNVSFDVDIHNNRMMITFANDDSKQVKSLNTINNLDFKRTDHGAGQLVLEFSDKTALVDVNEYAEKIVVNIHGATIANTLARNYDVRDFATVVNDFSVKALNNQVSVTLNAQESFDKISYQIDNKLIIELSSLKESNKKNLKNKLGFVGDKISLNYQDVSVRKVIQIIADFTNLNIIANDSVAGNITMRLQNVPWDQALDFILKTKGLAMKESQGIYLITPISEVSASEQAELNKIKQQENIANLVSDYVTVNYAKAADLVRILKGSSNNWISPRGQVTSDDRTNLLMIKDLPDNIEQIKALVKRLDVPIRQVLIESQLVLSSDTFEKQLGLKLGGGSMPSVARKKVGIGPNAAYARQFVAANTIVDPILQSLSASSSSSSSSSSSTGGSSGSSSSTSSAPNTLFFDSTATTPIGILGFALGNLPGGTLLDLELQAGEAESKSKTISKPKIITLDKVKASISQGTEIPYSVNAGNGLVTQQFKSAVLKLEVTPQISPDDTIFMDLTIGQDQPDSNGNIATMTMATSVSVPDGQTIVLGGIFALNDSNTNNKVPFFGDLPFIGKVFRNDTRTFHRSELLIFITPKIVRKP